MILVMTAKAFPFSHDFLNQVSTKIVNNVKVKCSHSLRTELPLVIWIFAQY